MHTYIHACIHAYIHACMHKYTHTHTYVYGFEGRGPYTPAQASRLTAPRAEQQRTDAASGTHSHRAYMTNTKARRASMTVQMASGGSATGEGEKS